MRERLAAACCGVCLMLGLSGLMREIAGPLSLSHFARVRFKVPPGSVVEINGRNTTHSVYLNTLGTHTVFVRHQSRTLLVLGNYRPPAGGETFDLTGGTPTAPMPRPVVRRPAE